VAVDFPAVLAQAPSHIKGIDDAYLAIKGLWMHRIRAVGSAAFHNRFRAATRPHPEQAAAAKATAAGGTGAG
jgi:hypothetical protein